MELTATEEELTASDAELLSFDAAHVWHPYGTAPAAVGGSRLVGSAHGVRLRLQHRGRWIEAIDAMASWWCAIHGYAVPELDRAAVTQLGQMSHVMFGGLTHRPAVELASELLRLAPRDPAGGVPPLEHVFFADSGSVAVEVAVKMAWQAHAAGGLTRRKLFTLRGGYFGDTFSPMSVCDPEGGMHAMYAGLVPRHVFAPRPPGGVDRQSDDEELAAWEVATRRLYAQHADEIAAVIVEPVLQGAGGMHAYSPHVVRVLAELARSHGALVIFDEIATGFWRTGTRWAADRCGVAPDILCVGKALTGGYLTLAAVLCTAEVAARVRVSPPGALMHGPTFMANPLACAIALASVRLLEERSPAETIGRIEADLTAGLAPARALPAVSDVRVLGAVGVIELTEPVRVAAVTDLALDAGVWVRPFRNLVYTMPPYACSSEEIASITAALVGAVAGAHR